jgi:hypothetical protein
MLELFKRAVLAAVGQPWVLDYVVPIAQVIAGLAWRRMARRRPLRRADLAIGPDLLTAALAIWLAVLALINAIAPNQLQRANLELAWQAFLLTAAIFVALPHAVRILWLDPTDKESPTPVGVAVQNGLGTFALFIVYFASTHWLS